MKRALLVIGLLGLTACAPPVPDSGAQGPGFDSYSDPSDYRVQRDAELNGTAPDGSTPLLPPNQSSVPGTPGANSEQGGGQTGTPGQLVLNNPELSDEQDFSAVSGRETIQSDAERLKLQRAAYEQVLPTAVPTRTSSGPNIVAYAISTVHPVGQKMHRRSVLGGQSKFERNCAKYASPDLAQEAFLAQGGPEKDKLGLDPDGDGYACRWNPVPFRRLAG